MHDICPIDMGVFQSLDSGYEMGPRDPIAPPTLPNDKIWSTLAWKDAGFTGKPIKAVDDENSSDDEGENGRSRNAKPRGASDTNDRSYGAKHSWE